MTYCLDSWAVLAWMADDAPAAERVETVLEDRPVMSWINAGEVFYVTDRLRGRGAADAAIHFLASRVDLDVPTRERVLAAATIKSEHRLAYADAFAVATALAHGAVLLTGDPEILSSGEPWPVENLRRR